MKFRLACTLAIALVVATTGMGQGVRINECFTGVPDWCEIVNLGPSPVNIGGWRLVMTDDPSTVTQLTFPAGTILQPGEVAIVAESASSPSVPVGTQYFVSANINWAGPTSPNDPDGACGLNNSAGAGIDRVIFGSPTNLPIQNPVSPFSGFLPISDIYARNSTVDTDSSADWTTGPSSIATPGFLQPGQVTPDVGQANQPSAFLDINGGTNLNGFPATIGENGPFSAQGNELHITVNGNPNQPFVLMIGPLNRNNLVGVFGSLDIGLLGSVGNFSDITFLMNGATGTSFFDQFAWTNGSGNSSMTFGLPGLPPGVLGTFQAAVFTGGPTTIALSAAFEFTVTP